MGKILSPFALWLNCDKNTVHPIGRESICQAPGIQEDKAALTQPYHVAARTQKNSGYTARLGTETLCMFQVPYGAIRLAAEPHCIVHWDASGDEVCFSKTTAFVLESPNVP